MKDDDILNEILAKALKDPTFRKRLFSEPHTILSSYNLSEHIKSLIIKMLKE